MLGSTNDGSFAGKRMVLAGLNDGNTIDGMSDGGVHVLATIGSAVVGVELGTILSVWVRIELGSILDHTEEEEEEEEEGCTATRHCTEWPPDFFISAA